MGNGPANQSVFRIIVSDEVVCPSLRFSPLFQIPQWSTGPLVSRSDAFWNRALLWEFFLQH